MPTVRTVLKSKLGKISSQSYNALVVKSTCHLPPTLTKLDTFIGNIRKLAWRLWEKDVTRNIIDEPSNMNHEGYQKTQICYENDFEFECVVIFCFFFISCSKKNTRKPPRRTSSLMKTLILHNSILSHKHNNIPLTLPPAGY